MHVITANDIATHLDYQILINALETAFKAGVMAPPRHHHTIPRQKTGADATLLLMPAWDDDAIGTKMVTVFPSNNEDDKPAIQGLYFLADGTTGEAKAVFEAKELTKRRTAAASALAARYLAPKDAHHMLMVGTGALAEPLITCHLLERPSLNRISIWGRSPDKAKTLASRLQEKGINATAVTDLAATARKADIISTATLSRTPLIKGDWLKAGCHLDLVGAFKPIMRESDDQCISRAQLFVDTRAGALIEGGDIAQPLKAGLITEKDIQADLYDLCQNTHKGRASNDAITLFKSVGASIEDFIAAKLVTHTMEL